MKKIFTSLFLMATALVATAQNFTVTAFEGTKTLKDGDVIECGYEEAFPGYFLWDPSIVVTCNKNLTLTVTANADMPAEGAVAFCGITGQCQLLKGTPETRSNAYNAGDKVAMELHTDGNVVEPVNATLKITDGAETVNITVTFVAESQEELAISSVAAKGTQVRVSGRTLHFVTDTAAELTLYTISGQSAISRRISGTGSLNLTNLPAGVYIYRAGNKTGKIILR